MSGSLPLIAGWCLELGLLTAALAGLSRLAASRAILGLTLASFALRVAIGETLYAVSAGRLPFLPQYQMDGGFWRFGYDAFITDVQAQTIFQLGGGTRLGALHAALSASSSGIAAATGVVPGTILLNSFTRLIAIVYALFGFSQSQGLLVVAAAAAACVPLAYLTGRSLELGRAGAAGAAFVVAAWPSSYIWSSVVLKDTLQWLGIFLMAAGVTAFFARLRHGFAWRPLLAPLGLAVAGELVAAQVRDYTTPLWLASIVAGAVVLLAATRSQAIGRRAAACLVLLGAIALASLTGDVGKIAQRAAELAAPAPSQASAPASPASVPASGTSLEQPGGAAEASGAPPAAAGQAVCPPIKTLYSARRGFQYSEAASQIDPGVDPVSCLQVIEFAPRALDLAFVAPPPGEWLASSNATGARVATGIDLVALWLLLPGLLASVIMTCRRPSPGFVTLLVFVVLLGFALGFAITIFGALFRLRLQFLLPASVLSMAGWLGIARASAGLRQQALVKRQDVGAHPFG